MQDGQTRGNRRTKLVAGLLATVLVGVGGVVGFKTINRTPGPLFEPVIPDGPATLAELCDDICTADLVALPDLRVVETAVDLPMPETTGALSIERVWTGQRNGMFGAGWESIWDLRVTDGLLTGPVPAEPLTRAKAGGSVELSDGTTIDFDKSGRPEQICPDAALCTSAKWSKGNVTLSVASVQVNLELESGKVVSASSSDDRTVDYAYNNRELTRVENKADATDYSYVDGHLSRINGTSDRSFSYENGLVTSMVDHSGKTDETWSFTKISTHEIQVTQPDEEVVTYEFADGNLVTATSSESGSWLTREYRGDTPVEESRPRDGVEMTLVATNTLEVTQDRDLEPAELIRYTIDSSGRVIQTQSADGAATIEYDGRSDRPLKIGNGPDATSLTYDEHGLLIATEDADGYTVTIDRDELGQIRSVSDGILETTFAYDETGATIEETSAGRTTTAQFHDDGRLEAIGLADGTKTAVAYDSSNAVKSIGSDDVKTVVGQIDDLLADSAEPGDEVTDVVMFDEGPQYEYKSGRKVQYDDWGRLTKLFTPEGSSTRSYDDHGRLDRLSLPDGRTYSLTYTPAGRIASVSDGTVGADLTWHGDLLLRAITREGTDYRYEYHPDGMLKSSQVGEARWEYQYDDVGNLSSVTTPSGALSYSWDAHGRPTSARIDGQHVDYVWAGEEFDLDRVIGSAGDLVRFARDGAGQVTEMETEDGEATFAYTDGILTSYELTSGLKATLTYDDDGQIATVTHDGTTEKWHWTAGELTAVTIDKKRYDLEWLAPGVLAAVTQGEEPLMRTDLDESGRPIKITSGDKPAASFAWSDAGLVEASLDKWMLELDYDREFRPTRLSDNDSKVIIDYERGANNRLSVDESTIRSTYGDGRIKSSSFVNGDDRVDIRWNEDGQPKSFTGPEENGSFDYRSGRVSTIWVGDSGSKVEYRDGEPTADGAAGDFLDDLFADDGRFAVTAGEHLTQPYAPWFDALPTELELALPTTLTADDVVSAAIASATPSVTSPIRPDKDIAAQTGQMVLSLASPNAIPVAVDRMGTYLAGPAGADTSGLLAASPTALVGASTLDNLADGPGLLKRALNFGGSIIATVGKAGAAVLQFLADTALGQVVVGFLGIAATAACVASAACPAAAAAAIGVLSIFAPALIVNGGNLADAVSTAIIEPASYLWTGLQSLNPFAIIVVVGLTAAVVVAGGARFGPVLAKKYPRLARVQRTAVSPVCAHGNVVCMSAERFGDATTHVVDAQRRGAARLLKVDRSGATKRRYRALKEHPRVRGLDLDEYPPAVSSVRTGLSVRPISPSNNRSAGRYLGHQISGIPDGSRFYVLPIA